MAYFRDRRGQPRPVRELLERLGRATTSRSLPHAPTAPGVAAPNGSPALQCNSVQEEMSARFRQCSSDGTESCSTSVARRSRFPAARYSPYTRAAQQRAPAKSFTRTIFLLQHDEYFIPRGLQRQNMYEQGRVVDFVEMSPSWSEEQVRMTINDVFSKVLSDSGPPNGRYSYSSNYVLQIERERERERETERER